jgi:vancomycin resistance protein YoaR
VLARPVELTVGASRITVPPTTVGAALGAVARGRQLDLVVDPAALRRGIGAALASIETAPRDADFTVNGTRVSVVPSVTGRQVDLTRVGRQIADGTHHIRAALAEVTPAHDTAWAEGLHITGLVSTYTTEHPCCAPRVTNIHVAAAALNGAIVEPGQTFSLNQRLGPRTLEKGYVVAPQIAANLDYEDSVGGGVSQVSTTLFNAVFFGGYQDVTHTVHALYISRYPMGREATLNYPSIDNRFRNDTRNGVLIRTAVSGTSVTVSLYGNNEGRTVRAEGPNVLGTTPITVEYTPDPTLPAGVEKELSPGHIGYVVENFRIIRYADGTERRQRFVERYQMAPRKVARGGGAPTGSTGPTGTTGPPPVAPTTTAVPPPPPPSTP